MSPSHHGKIGSYYSMPGESEAGLDADLGGHAEEDQCGKEYVRVEEDQCGDPTLPALTIVLRAAGAGECWHKHVTFLAHLLEVYWILLKVFKDANADAGHQLNNDITAPFLRLVSDGGHDVVPRHEALQMAARMGLDLVEVGRKSNPPVCKIMDFHKEKYNKDAQQKQRLKTKSAIALRGGDIKEVWFKAKTEMKDMKVKADAITRLMEHGYKVKSMAMPAGNEAEDLGGPLSRLLGLVRTPFCTMEHLKRIAEEMQKQVAVAGAIQPKEENDLEFGCIM
ncbi:hypothetical protein ZWY2020_042521 [Hordeum vulgare]|nr:hypothetical protein ZWY2020_042521 [Hordeum vulgare]